MHRSIYMKQPQNQNGFKTLNYKMEKFIMECVPLKRRNEGKVECLCTGETRV